MAGAGGDDVLRRIHDALKIVHSPYSTNASRQEAQGFLEEVKALPDAPSHGFALASDKSQPPIVRHYSLSLLEHAVKHRWAEYTPEQAQSLRTCILQLSQAVSKDDPSYLRTKIAQLWVEVAKRCWAAEWMDMDELLFRLWQVPDSPVHREFVLQILEMLSDEILRSDDAVVAIREGALSKACVEIFTPAAVLLESFPKRQANPYIRYGDEGWLDRVARFLSDCLAGDVQNDEDIRACALRALAVLYSLMPWILPKAISATGCVASLCNALAAPHVSVQKAALEALHALYSQLNFSESEFVDLVVPMYNPEFTDLCRRLFEWSTVDAQDIDDDKYQFAKKFSEMISCLGNYLDRRFSALPDHVSIKGFLELALLVVQSQSLLVSIPVLVTWTRLLGHSAIGPAAADTPLIAPLLEVCSSRLIRYENLPEDTQDPTYVFLMEDTDTIPERHAFLGNYRRYSSQVIESIVRLKLSDALVHILNQAENLLNTVCSGQAPPLDPATYSKNSMTVLKVDAHFTVVEAALKGYCKWRTSRPHDMDKHLHDCQVTEVQLEAWSRHLIEYKIEDPVICKRILQLLVAFSTTALERNATFMLKVLEHILMTWPTAQPEYKVFNEAIKDLQTESLVELQRLASKMPDHLLDVYDQLESKVQEMIASGTLDEKRQIAYQSFLFIIIHRATRINMATRIERLKAFVEPVKAQWTEPYLKQALGSFDGFCQLMALDKAQDYLARRRIHELADWGSADLDAEGLALQNELEHRQTVLPLRSTKAFLTYSVEKIEKGSASYEASCTLWQDGFPIILPELLSFLTHAHAAHNPKNWTNLPPEMQPMVNRVLTDRFWQAGISEGSKDDFYARVMDKKSTVEGLASTIRGSVRFVREACYAIIYCMSRLDLQFYGFSELPGPLANALFTDCTTLSAHQIINLLNLVRYLVDRCPVELREHFLPPILAACFSQMDVKISAEWQKLGQQENVQAAGEELTEEMKAESILRQLTYTAVVMVADFLDPSRSNTITDSTTEGGGKASSKANYSAADEAYPSLRKFCLMQTSITAPLLTFCKNAINMHDGRCCGVVLRVFRSIIPEFQRSAEPPKQPSAVGGSEEGDITIPGQQLNPPHHQQAGKGAAAAAFPIPEATAKEIREFISTEVLKAAIQSLHDPYFVDSQRELGTLIASILVSYCPLTPTPRAILLSLPNMRQLEVDQTIEYLLRPDVHSRQQRVIVLDLLKDLKGVSISEMGRLAKSLPAPAGTNNNNDSNNNKSLHHHSHHRGASGSGKRAMRSKMAQEFMTPAAPGGTGRGGEGGGDGGDDHHSRKTPDLEGVAGMFNDGG